MKKVILSGLLIAAFATTMSAKGGGDKPKNSKKEKVVEWKFTDTPKMDKANEAGLGSLITQTIVVAGSGGYDAGTGKLCPCSSCNSTCGTVTTSYAPFPQDVWGPAAMFETQEGPLQGPWIFHHYAAQIDSPIYGENENVINFNFFDVQQLD